MSERRYDREFGQGTLVGDNADSNGFFDLGIRDQARHLGWSNGCPNVEKLTSPKGYGPEWMRTRYAETNFVFGMILERARQLNYPLYIYLASERNRNEKIGESYEPQSAPADFDTKIPPTTTVVGYAASRVLIEQFGRNENRTQKRYLKGLEILDEVILDSAFSKEFLAKLAEKCIANSADAVAVFGHVLSKSFLDEENCQRQFRLVAAALATCTPKTWQAYNSISSEQKRNSDIAEPGDFKS